MTTVLTDAILYEIKEERKRQNEKWGIQRHPDEKWLVIAVEEIGELAQAIQKSAGSVASKTTDADSKIYEAIQAAAVLTAYAEQLLEQMGQFEPCSGCVNVEYCGERGRLCDTTSIGDPNHGEDQKI